MSYATPADVQVRMPEGTSIDTAYVQALLDDAELLIKSKIPDLDTRVATGDILVDLVVMVEANMVMRVIRNPDGFVQETDGNYSYSISYAVASGLLEVTDKEWGLLGLQTGIGLISMRTNVPWIGGEGWRSDPAYRFQYYTDYESEPTPWSQV